MVLRRGRNVATIATAYGVRVRPTGDKRAVGATDTTKGRMWIYTVSSLSSYHIGIPRIIRVSYLCDE